MVDREQLGEYVQEALVHLFDYAYLQAHPLAALVSSPGLQESPRHALHQLLRAEIEALKPPPEVPGHSPTWRAYRSLQLRYVEMLTMAQVAEELGISPRQCRRAHHEALQAIVAALWERQSAIQRARPAAPDRIVDPEALALLESEAARLAQGSTEATTELPDSAAGILATLEPLARARAAFASPGRSRRACQPWR